MKFKIKNYFKNKIVLITGGTGTIGSALALELLNYKCKAVRVLSNDENGLYIEEEITLENAIVSNNAESGIYISSSSILLNSSFNHNGHYGIYSSSSLEMTNVEMLANDRDGFLSAGDQFMVVKNNYFWLKPNSEAGFIANGDIIEVLELFAIKELYGFKFAEVKVKMVDYPNQKPFETVLLLDTITAETPSLSYEDGNKLYQEVMKDYAHEKSKYKKFLGVKNNRFFNALQVKFSYAITCHKSQGGQWEAVFVDQGYLTEEMVNQEYIRWLYTAVTRATKELYLVNFHPRFF